MSMSDEWAVKGRAKPPMMATVAASEVEAVREAADDIHNQQATE
jgi:hypothetical protein